MVEDERARHGERLVADAGSGDAYSSYKPAIHPIPARAA
jgi:hypothetical protein